MSVAQPSAPLLSVTGLTVSYGGIRAVRELSLAVPDGEVVALLGPNGAGKTTTMRAIMGLLRASGGSVVLAGEELSRAPGHRRFHAGLALVPEGRGIVASFSVAENLRLGAMFRRNDAWTLDDVFDLFPRLAERRSQEASSLSGGEQQMLAIARALLSGPRVLLLDEPTMGLAPIMVERVFEALARVKERGAAMLIAEQNAHQALALADYAYVLERGQVGASGRPEELGDAASLASSYLSTE